MIKKIIFLILGLTVALAIFFPIYVYHALGQSGGSSEEAVDFEVASGETTRDIMNRLYDEGLIKDKLAFLVYCRLKEKTLKAGLYSLAPNYSLKTIIDSLDGGEHIVHRITIPEGWRTEQIAQRLDSQGVIGYQDFLTAANGQEGYLFPDTYEFKKGVTAEDIVLAMTNNFAKKTSDLNITSNDLVLASIIEKEAENDTDRPVIAGIFTNRLKIDMKLQSDVTVIYQKDSNNYPKVGILDYKFWQGLSSGDTSRIQGSYNTYLNYNLPPAPICNPGLKSIEAAVSPAATKYYYFLYDDSGQIHYALTQTEQDKNANKYLY